VRLRRSRTDTDEVHDRTHPRVHARLIALVLLTAYAIAFIIENSKPVRVHFVFATTRVSLVGLTLVALAVGLFGGILLAQLQRRRRRRSHQAPEH
jgi:hypothetical protein